MDVMQAYERLAGNPASKKWRAIFRDRDGKDHSIHFTTENVSLEDAEAAARETCRNWQLISIAETNERPTVLGQIPPEAHTFGIKQNILKKRLR